MTQEEKAEAYDKAIERAKNLQKDAIDMGENILAKQCEIIFPELKKSEDESIRKEIIAFLKENHETGRADETWSLSGIERWVAWLEKQGKNPQCKSIIEAWKDMRLEVYQQASGNRHEPNYSDDTTKMFSLNDIDEIIEKINEQTEKQGEQKPAWSEEDDDMLDNIIDDYDDADEHNLSDDIGKVMWLKSLKQRMNK